MDEERRRPTRDEAIRLARAGLNDVIRDHVHACAAPLFWYDQAAPIGARIVNNGTIFF